MCVLIISGYFMRYFTSSILVTILAFAIAFYWAGLPAVMICALLTLMEVSFSFDNAVVNATVLKNMDNKWQNRFLTWGMLFAVFGVRFIFPIMIVSFATGLGFIDVTHMAVDNPEEYSRHVLESHVQIGAFGGMFLMMVFLKFILNETKDIHWIGAIESKLVRLGKLEAVEVIIALSMLLGIYGFLDEVHQLPALSAGVVGVVLYVLVNGITALTGGDDAAHGHTQAAVSSGLMGFIYLQFLDASFSLDGVIGAFAMSKDIVIIMLGLGAGAMFVRSLTVWMVRKGTLDQYRYLEHGAHYGIGALAVIMLVSMIRHVPEVVTGFVGIAFIVLSLVSSIKHNRSKPR